MNKLFFLFKLEFIKKPKKNWSLIITSNRCNKSIPLKITNYKDSSLYIDFEITKGKYLGRKNPIEFTFYFYKEGFKKSKSYKSTDLINTKNEIKLGKDMSFYLYKLDNVNDINTHVQHKTGISFKNYYVEINKKLFASFKKIKRKYVIYYNLNPNKEIPIICSLLIDNEETNVTFWENCLNICKKVYKANNVEWKWKECFPSLFNIINTLINTYVLERKDTYLESWFSNFGDCDEANMICLLFKLFMKCDLEENEELNKIKNYISENYIDFYCFCIVSQASASSSYQDDSSSIGEQGHWIVSFIPKDWFLKRWKGKGRKGKLKNLRILFTEPTAFFHPNPHVFYKTVSKLIDERKMQFFKGSNFYKHILSAYTDYFFDKLGIFGFYTGYKNNYGIPINKFFEGDKKIKFVSMPKMTKDEINEVKHCTNVMLPIPDFIIDPITKEHKICFVTNEFIQDDIDSIDKFFASFPKREKGMKKIYSATYSLKDLLVSNIKKNIKEVFGDCFVKANRYEFMDRNYLYILKFYK